ncbi:MAG: carbohydrate-binding family 9-like protein [Verrucomicrobiales bacterium]
MAEEPTKTDLAKKPSQIPWPADQVAHYTAFRAESPLVIDGRLDEAEWKKAPRSPRFRHLIHGGRAIHDTRAAVIWDRTHLYVAFWIEEPDVQGDLTQRDSPIYKNNDVEVFIAGRDAYYEFEINSLGTIYEAFFIWEEAFERSGYHELPEFDRSDTQKVRPFNGVGFTTHPRGKRIGYWNWDFPGLQSAVHIDGTINDSSDRDRGWTVELAFPWAGMKALALADSRSLPPQDGDVWRIDFSRFNQYKEAPPSNDPGGWAWSPHGAWDSHIPECFPHVQFSDKPPTPSSDAPLSETE